MGDIKEMKAPHRAVVLVAKIDADNRRELASHLRNLAIDIERDKGFGVSISGGYSSGHIVHLYTDEHPTKDEYFAALNSWLEQQSPKQDKTP
jgi:hypothetical protein